MSDEELYIMGNDDDSRSSEPLKEEKGAQANEASAAQECQQNQPARKPADWPFPAYYKPSPIYVINSKNHEKWSIDWLKHRLEIAELCAGFIVLAILAFQSCVMNRQYREMARTTEAINGQIIVAQKQLQAMTDQGTIMQGQLDAMRIDERAWLGAAHINIQETGGTTNRTYFTVDFQNSGKTPALKVSVWIHGGTFIPNNWDIIEKNSVGTNGLNFSGMLTPNTTAYIHTIDDSIDDEEVKSIQAGMPYYVYGKISYDDIFMRHHWSEFCYLVALTPKFIAWPFGPHNSCDEAQTNQPNQ